jgi:hypothetical protein
MAAIIDLDTARPELRALLRRAKNPIAVHKVMAAAATREVRDHFAKVAIWQRNPFGKPPLFWKRMSRATRPEATATTAAVLIPREVAQRYFGGTIRPTGGRRLLTIPARAEAYRRSARSFDDLVLIIFKARSGRGPVGALIRHGKSESTVLYWLKRKVTQKSDQRVMPSTAQIASAVVPEVEAYLLREAGKNP